jgi:hypothetical protein
MDMLGVPREERDALKAAKLRLKEAQAARRIEVGRSNTLAVQEEIRRLTEMTEETTRRTEAMRLENNEATERQNNRGW